MNTVVIYKKSIKRICDAKNKGYLAVFQIDYFAPLAKSCELNFPSVVKKWSIFKKLQDLSFTIIYFELFM